MAVEVRPDLTAAPVPVPFPADADVYVRRRDADELEDSRVYAPSVGSGHERSRFERLPREDLLFRDSADATGLHAGGRSPMLRSAIVAETRHDEGSEASPDRGRG